MIGLETRTGKLVWHRPWDDTVYFEHPFTGQLIPVSKRNIPGWIEPEDLNRAAPHDKGTGAGRRDSASATHKSGGTNPSDGMTKGPTPGGEGSE